MMIGLGLGLTTWRGASALAVAGTIPDMLVQRSTGSVTVAAATAFANASGAAFSLVSPPSGVSIDSGTGVVTLATGSAKASRSTCRNMAGRPRGPTARRRSR